MVTLSIAMKKIPILIIAVLAAVDVQCAVLAACCRTTCDRFGVRVYAVAFRNGRGVFAAIIAVSVEAGRRVASRATLMVWPAVNTVRICTSRNLASKKVRAKVARQSEIKVTFFVALHVVSIFCFAGHTLLVVFSAVTAVIRFTAYDGFGHGVEAEAEGRTLDRVASVVCAPVVAVGVVAD
jgi:hypothetical protein